MPINNFKSRFIFNALSAVAGGGRPVVVSYVTMVEQQSYYMYLEITVPPLCVPYPNINLEKQPLRDIVKYWWGHFALHWYGNVFLVSPLCSDLHTVILPKLKLKYIYIYIHVVVSWPVKCTVSFLKLCVVTGLVLTVSAGLLLGDLTTKIVPHTLLGRSYVSHFGQPILDDRTSARDVFTIQVVRTFLEIPVG
jgi:hypothetical protein